MNVVAEEWRAENTGIESGVLETQQLGRACIRPFEIFPFFTSFHPFLRAREKKMAFRSNEEGGRGILSRFRLRLNRFVIGIDTNCDRNYSDRGSNVSVDRKHIFKDTRVYIRIYTHNNVLCLCRERRYRIAFSYQFRYRYRLELFSMLRAIAPEVRYYSSFPPSKSSSSS